MVLNDIFYVSKFALIHSTTVKIIDSLKKEAVQGYFYALSIKWRYKPMHLIFSADGQKSLFIKVKVTVLMHLSLLFHSDIQQTTLYSGEDRC